MCPYILMEDDFSLPVFQARHASFTKEVNPRLAERQLVFNGRLANRGLTSLVKEATVGNLAATVWTKC